MQRAEIHADLPQYVPTSSKGGQGGRKRLRPGGVVKRKALVHGHEALRRLGDRPQPGVHVSELRRGWAC
jgi:hypothetical protein